MYLEKINGPEDVKKLTDDEMIKLAAEMRSALLKRASIHGGHFGPNFGMVEATNTAPAPAGGQSQEKEKNVYKFLGAAAAASGRPDKIRPHSGGISGAARCRGTVSVHIIAGQRVSGGRGYGVPVLPGAGL